MFNSRRLVQSPQKVFQCGPLKISRVKFLLIDGLLFSKLYVTYVSYSASVSSVSVMCVNVFYEHAGHDTISGGKIMTASSNVLLLLEPVVFERVPYLSTLEV